ncbi:hypothetical protein, partial [Acetobacter senegalensis]|uniref:hypothetical protein n=1 Tax=Acetobacter senegalensis TaxID=446692 RepID=UPI001C3DBABD
DRSRRGDRPAHRTNPAQRVRSSPHITFCFSFGNGAVDGPFDETIAPHAPRGRAAGNRHSAGTRPPSRHFPAAALPWFRGCGHMAVEALTHFHHRAGVRVGHGVSSPRARLV